MIELDRLSKLIWIDHHKSAIEEYEQHNKYIDATIDGTRFDGIAACELTWSYFSEIHTIPVGITLLSKYDTWQLEDERVVPFQYGFRTWNYDTSPNNQSLWQMVFTGKIPIDTIVEMGKIIVAYKTIEDSEYIKSYSYEVDFNGYAGLAINRGAISSLAFKSKWDKTLYDIMISFVMKGNKWYVSLYTDKPEVDVSILAKKYGGGGHKQAAGFNTIKLPFTALKRI